MAKDEEEPSRGFKVQDRRRFAGGDAGEDAERPEPATAAPSPPPARAPAPAHPHDHAHEHGDGHDHDHDHAHEPMPEVTFTTFVMGLTTQALMHLGEIEDPHAAGVKDLGAAKQMIDLLGILRAKTKGNLEAGEAQLLDSMLYDLRMRYVEVARGG